MDLQNMFNRARVDDRLVNELIGLANGIVADGSVNQHEAEFLQKWLAANSAVTTNPVVQNLTDKIAGVLDDGVLDSEEAADLLDTLQRFGSGDFELGELLKSTSLPLDNPAPGLEFEGCRFCFTGTFAYGSRRQCEAAVRELGGQPGSLTLRTDYLVIGVYATGSWAHSSYGRKIEKALEMRDRGSSVALVGEQHWIGQMGVI